jgi:mannosylfructose-phosphate synthase
MIPPGYDDNRFFPVARQPERHPAAAQLSGKVVITIGGSRATKVTIYSSRLPSSREPEAVLHLAIGGAS